MHANALGYRTWKGRLRPGWMRWWPIARVGMASVCRRKIFWLFLLLGLLNFLFHFALIYFLAQIAPELRSRDMPPFVRNAVVSGTGKSYRDFISLQGTVVMLFLGFAGAVLVGNDFRFRAVAFYLSKPIGKIHYFLGKLVAVAGLTSLITLVPAVILFVEYGAFKESLDYFRESQSILWAIVGYGALVSVVSAVLILGVSSLLQRTIPIVVVWGAIFILLPMIGATFRSLSRSRGGEGWYWSLIDFWAVLRWISNSFFGIQEDVYDERLPWALLVLAGWMVLSIACFWSRVRAVEVVR